MNRLIRQFEAVYKSTTDYDQKDRVAGELKKLKNYRDKVTTFHVIDEEEMREIDRVDEFMHFPFLKEIREIEKENEEDYYDREIFHLDLYLIFFEREFLALLSETRCKLDFKYSMERDSYYHRFEYILRQMQDFEDDAGRVRQYQGKQEEDMRKRIFKKKRNLNLEADRFFRSLIKFSSELLEDIDSEGLKCLNCDEVITFDKIEGNKYLKGFRVREALEKLNAFCREVVEYLNVPQIEVQES